MDLTTEKVRQQYLRYPFPNSGENIDFYANANWFIEMLSFLEEVAPENKQSFLDNSSVLEAGCGTGPTIAKIAQLYPSCHAVGLDMASEALKIAQSAKEKHHIDNVSFQEANLLEMQLDQKFDVIIAIGVLHHLSDMNLGLEKLKSHLSEGGYLFLWLYGKHGRYRLNLHQRLFKTLFANVNSIEEKVALTKSFLTNANDANIISHIDTPDQVSIDFFKENLEQTLKNESWLVDQYLHEHENVLTMSDILSLLEKHNLNLVRWLGVNTSIQAHVNCPEIASLFSTLSQTEQLTCLDLLLKPNYYMLAIN